MTSLQIEFKVILIMMNSFQCDIEYGHMLNLSKNGYTFNAFKKTHIKLLYVDVVYVAVTEEL